MTERGEFAADRMHALLCDELRQIQPSLVLTGMARGFDLVLGLAALELNIPYGAVIPCADQAGRWSEPLQEAWRTVRRGAAWETILAPHYTPGCMLARNRWMVEHCTHVLACWDGEPGGGTAQCLAAAWLLGRPWRNTWTRWTVYRDWRVYADPMHDGALKERLERVR